jgi:hypothetical protein
MAASVRGRLFFVDSYFCGDIVAAIIGLRLSNNDIILRRFNYEKM